MALFQMVRKTVALTMQAWGVELCSSRLRVGLSPLKNSLCIHAFVAVSLMTEEDSLFYTL